MGAHSLGQFFHFNIATRTRAQREADTENRRRDLIRRLQEQIDAQKPDEPVAVERRSWWRRLWAWMTKGAE